MSNGGQAGPGAGCSPGTPTGRQARDSRQAAAGRARDCVAQSRADLSAWPSPRLDPTAADSIGLFTCSHARRLRWDVRCCERPRLGEHQQADGPAPRRATTTDMRQARHLPLPRSACRGTPRLRLIASRARAHATTSTHALRAALRPALHSRRSQLVTAAEEGTQRGPAPAARWPAGWREIAAGWRDAANIARASALPVHVACRPPQHARSLRSVFTALLHMHYWASCGRLEPASAARGGVYMHVRGRPLLSHSSAHHSCYSIPPSRPTQHHRPLPNLPS